MAIKVRNDQMEGTRWKKQNNVMRMVLFYATCGLVVALVSYGGLVFTKSSLKSGIAKSDPATLASSINFDKVNRTIRGQMPGMLDKTAVAETDSPYMASADIKYAGKVLEVSPENIAELLEKGGMISKSANGEISYDNLDSSIETWGYSRISVKVVNEQDKNLWLLLNIQKDESLIQWKVVGSFMSEPLRDKVLE